MMTNDSSRTPPLERYFSLLEILAGYPGGATLNELCKFTGLPKASLHRALSVLVGVGLVEIGDGSGPRYILGARCRRLAFLAAGNDFLEAASHQQLKALCEEFDETCYLARLEGITVRSAVMVSPDHAWRGYVLPGKQMQHHTNASAKAIFAFQPPELLEQVFALPRPRLTRFTITGLEELQQDYARIRESGYATCIEEVEEGLAAFAVPVEVATFGVQFSLAMVGPKTKILPMLEGGALERFRRASSVISTFLSRR